jgi:hypothetical protein
MLANGSVAVKEVVNGIREESSSAKTGLQIILERVRTAQDSRIFIGVFFCALLVF